MAYLETLLLTRPQPASERFAKEVRAELGALDILFAPLMEIEGLEIPEVPEDSAVAFTSRNGVDAWARSGQTTQRGCFCVGEATAKAARDIGFDPFVSGGTVEHLIEDLRNANLSQEIVHIHGRHTRGDLVGTLARAGIKARSYVGYEQKLLDLSQEADALLRGGAPVIVPLFSPRIAAQFMQTGPFDGHVDVIAISKAAEQSYPGARIAARPNAAGMIEAISRGLHRGQ